MTHLVIKRLAYSELKEMFKSQEVKRYLRDNASRFREEPFIYRWNSNEDPSVDIARTVDFGNDDVVWIDFLIIDDIKYIPEISEFKSIN